VNVTTETTTEPLLTWSLNGDVDLDGGIPMTATGAADLIKAEWSADYEVRIISDFAIQTRNTRIGDLWLTWTGTPVIPTPRVGA
jgi:hypothetical protein